MNQGLTLNWLSEGKVNLYYSLSRSLSARHKISKRQRRPIRKPPAIFITLSVKQHIFGRLGFSQTKKKKEEKNPNKKHDGQAQQLSLRDDSHCRQHSVIERGIIAAAMTGTSWEKHTQLHATMHTLTLAGYAILHISVMYTHKHVGNIKKTRADTLQNMCLVYAEKMIWGTTTVANKGQFQMVNLNPGCFHSHFVPLNYYHQI